ncbi:MAG TPA: MFS transporter [Kofleriaceae bacterium]|nr:MFS transporter [Kofleriaceae bacterium]
MDKPTPWWKEPTRAQWGTFVAAWVGWVLDAFDTTVFILVMRHIAKEFHVGVAAVSGSLTLTLLVRLAGGYAAGWMADRWGRKLPLMISLVWLAVFDAAIYFAPSFTAILVLRTIFGFGMGAEWTAGTAMAMESWPARSRRLASGLLQAGWPVGFLLAALTAYFVVPAWGWRPLFLFAAVPALLVLPIRWMVPATHSRPAAATRASSRELLAPAVLRMLVLGSLVMALGFVVYYGMTVHYPMMLIGERHFSAQRAFLHVILFNAGMLGGVIAAGAIAARRGVIVALVVPAALMLPALPLFLGQVGGLSWLGAILGGALGVGYSGVTPILLTSLFDERIRARAIGLVYHAGALLSAFVPSLVPAVAAHFHLSLAGAMGAVAGSGLLLLVVAVLALRQTLTGGAAAAAMTADHAAPPPAEPAFTAATAAH